MRERGDTIIEVIFAVTVFSIIAVGGLALMNQGAAMAQRSLEIGMVRDQMDAQGDALRYLHDAYIASLGQGSSSATTVWNDVTSHAVQNAGQQTFDNTSDGQRCTLKGPANGQGSPFAIDLSALKTTNDPTLVFPSSAWNASVPTTSGTSTDLTYAQVRYPTSGSGQTTAQGIWIQAIHNPRTGSTLGSYDFDIYACWLTPGQSSPVTLGTVVRLYDPN